MDVGKQNNAGAIVEKSEVTTPGQGLFLTIRCISTIHGGQKEDDCRDAGGRATQGAVAEVELRQEQQPRAMQEHDYTDVGVRVAPGDLQGRRKLGQRRSSCRNSGRGTAYNPSPAPAALVRPCTSEQSLPSTLEQSLADNR